MHATGYDRRSFMWQIGMSAGVAKLFPNKMAIAAQAAPGEVGTSLELRKEELRRRVESLPAEIGRWQARASNEQEFKIHFSQVHSLGILLDPFTVKQLGMLDALKPAGDAGDFLRQCDDLVNEIIRAQAVWDFYREKLLLRFSPGFKESLRVADIAAWDCYRPVLEDAADLRILTRAQMREPPLCYYVADFSPATWVRGSEPNDLRDRTGATIETPIPVIMLPWDHAQNLWEFLSLAHEVGHDLEADLKLRTALLQSLEGSLRNGGVPDARIRVWKAWQAETFADLVGLQLVGVSFLEALMNLLLLPPAAVTAYNGADPHPTHYIRILMGAAYVRGLVQGNQPAEDRQRQELSKDADRIERVWLGLYGGPARLRDYLADFPLVFQGLMDTPLPALKDQTVRAIIPYTAADDIRIRAAADYLESGLNRPGELRPRHCLAAARLAATRSGRQRPGLDTVLKLINDRTAELVDANKPPGLLEADSKAHSDFVAGFAKTITRTRTMQKRLP